MEVRTVTSIDVPQQDDLTRIRTVLEALENGVERAGLGEASGLSGRHLRYALNAARTLGWVEREGPDGWAPTATGRELLVLESGSQAERIWLHRSLESNPLIEQMAPSLLGTAGPSVSGLADHLIALTGLSPSTAQRRAMTLLAWRDQAVLDVEAVQAVARESAEPVPVRVEVRYEGTAPGDVLVLVGDPEVLGAWDPDGAARFSPSPWPRWRCDFALEPGAPIECKVVILHADGTATWQSGPNRRITPPARHPPPQRHAPLVGRRRPPVPRSDNPARGRRRRRASGVIIAPACLSTSHSWSMENRR